jgi:uncharacterized protein YidB (DUF937 family)
MRLIHEVIESLRGWHDEEVTPLGAALIELLGGERGSLPELADRFTEAGLGPVMASWTGDGPKLPISTQDLRRVLGEERVGDLATLTGLPSDEFLAIFVRVLPNAIHRMTREPESEAPVRSRRVSRAGGRSNAA